jgi:DNA-binding MarR family transcriptional regulator
MTQDVPPPSTHPLERFLGYQLRRAAGFMQADLAERLSSLGVTMVEMSVLLVIEANPLITQSDIGRMLSIKRANMTPLAAILVARGLLDKQAVDRRSQGLMLTKDGATLVQKLHALVAENEDRLLESVPQQERQRLIELLHLVWAKR